MCSYVDGVKTQRPIIFPLHHCPAYGNRHQWISIGFAPPPLGFAPPSLRAPESSDVKSCVIDSIIRCNSKQLLWLLKCLAPCSTWLFSSFEAFYPCESHFFLGAPSARDILIKFPAIARRRRKNTTPIVFGTPAPCSWSTLLLKWMRAEGAPEKFRGSWRFVTCEGSNHRFCPPPPSLRVEKGEEGGAKPMEFHWLGVSL